MVLSVSAQEEEDTRIDLDILIRKYVIKTGEPCDLGWKGVVNRRPCVGMNKPKTTCC